MNATVRIAGHPGAGFSVTPNQTILEAALAAGLLLPYGCRDGACGACRARLVEGQIEYHGPVAASALTEEERAQGWFLPCRAHARTDLVIAVRELRRANDFPVHKFPARVEHLERAADDVMILTLKRPASLDFRFRAGQYVDVLLPDGARRSFSLANAPEENDFLELHVRLVPGGRFTTHVFTAMKPKEVLRLEGPLGSFFLREESTAPILFLAGGTGFAPIQSMLQHMHHAGIARPAVLYWGARTRAGLYRHEWLERFAAEHPWLRYVPVLSEPLVEDRWEGRTELVHRAVLQDFPTLAGHEVYACGAPAMIEAARRDFLIQGLDVDAFHSDAFTFANPS